MELFSLLTEVMTFEPHMCVELNIYTKKNIGMSICKTGETRVTLVGYINIRRLVVIVCCGFGNEETR